MITRDYFFQHTNKSHAELYVIVHIPTMQIHALAAMASSITSNLSPNHRPNPNPKHHPKHQLLHLFSDSLTSCWQELHACAHYI